MRVLMSASTYPIRADDGLPRFVYDLSEALARRCKVTALVPGAPGAPARERMGAVDVRRFTYFLPRGHQRLAYGNGMRDNLRASWLCKLQPLPFLLQQVRETRALTRELGIDVVNSHWLVPQGLSTALARRAGADFRHLLTVHAADVYMLRKLPLGGALARFILSESDAVFADGSHVRDSLDELAGSPSHGILQPNGVETALFGTPGSAGPAPSPFPGGYLLFFGRFAEKKGVAYLLQAMPRILERHPDLGLVLIGHGTLEGELRAEVARLGVGRSVQFTGRKSHPEIASYLHGCRLAVVPSIIDRHGETEGMPTVVVEAMAAGTRVVASAVDGIPDVVRHGENGWLCREKDPGDLAGKILMALEDPAASAVVEGALATAQRFDWAAVADNYVEAFERILAARRGRRVPA